MLALKFGRGSFKQFIPFVIVLLVAMVVALIWGWLAVPAAFIAYVILSLLTKQGNHDL
jgi:CDP-diacylglycerol--serine O-phosphatidyltransferase